MLGPSGFFVPANASDLETGAENYELIHSSQNGFNELYRICKNGRFFVYKALQARYRGNLLYEELLTKDFNIGFSLSHSGICQYFAKIHHPQLGNCIVMEWLDGHTLEELIDKGDINKATAQKIALELCDALGYLHHKQIIHRDLKPENIIITHNGKNVKIIDFGLSDADSYATLKAPAGTKAYASPELLAGEPIDARSDIWSLGLILSELSSTFRHVSKGCLKKDKSQRYPDTESIKRAISKARTIKTIALCTLAIIAAAVCAITILANQNSTSTTTPVPTIKEPTIEKIPEQPVENIEAPTTNDTNTESHKKETPVTRTTPEDKCLDKASLEDLFKEAAAKIN